MRRETTAILASGMLLAATMAVGWVSIAGGEEILAPQEVTSLVELEDVSFAKADLQISGIVHNRSDQEVREVRLLIRYSYHWPNEYKPGEASPSRAVYYTVPGAIPPGGRVEFRYRPALGELPPSPAEYGARVELVGFLAVRRPAPTQGEALDPEG
jgi:hypothetical protein